MILKWNLEEKMILKMWTRLNWLKVVSSIFVLNLRVLHYRTARLLFTYSIRVFIIFPSMQTRNREIGSYKT
jgi:hypothetical protein